VLNKTQAAVKGIRIQYTVGRQTIEYKTAGLSERSFCSFFFFTESVAYPFFVCVFVSDTDKVYITQKL